jgi:o-succinylbenzoate synthase
MNYSIQHNIFHFKNPSGTSRGVLTEKHAWFISLWDEENPSVKGVGECSIIAGLSPDYVSNEHYEAAIHDFCKDYCTSKTFPSTLNDFPSIKFGIETAVLDLKNGGKGLIFENDFSINSKKLPINGLIWMGDQAFMEEQIEQKLTEGFSTLKMKVGAIDFEKEISILASIRSRFSKDEITLRVDANGAFSKKDALSKLTELAKLDLHSIEQPIQAGDWQGMKELCHVSPLPIALDEELIGIVTLKDKNELLKTIQTPFIILKPSLHGGIEGTKEWIELAEEKGIQWWITSALESNIGLNAICQLAAEYTTNLPQGLGTGSLYTNNIESDLCVENGFIFKKKTNQLTDSF